MSLKVTLGHTTRVHEPCPREHGCQKMTPVCTGRVDTLVTNTACEHWCHFLTPLFTTGRVHGP